ncbi:hypothetical protein FANTH_12962 [Fusarium anthophilum]|uniref:Uncharacterized protein n=1 Tax=Fusarium anthophilum TaxID=48485 RepID=A0A8H4YQX8_9HYPO|nr:hypothetical protein FANTH_12962 [Fusarium anthophilum]
MASSSTQKSFDHSSIDYVKIGPRRAHMKAFFLHLGLWNEEKVKIFREYGEEQACELVHSAELSQINQVYFELMVDQIVWFNLINDGNALGQGHDWPWTIEGVVEKTDVTTDGASGFYRDWRLRKLESNTPTTDKSTPGASSSQGALAADTATGSSAASKAPGIAPVQQAAKPMFGQQVRRPLAEQQGYGMSSSIWAPKPPANPKPPADNSVDISRVTTAIADISLGVAAAESAKREMEKEKATAEAAASDVKAKRLGEKIRRAEDIYLEEMDDIRTQRSLIDHRKFLDAKAKAVENGCSPDDWQDFAEEDDDNELVIPLNAKSPVRHDFGFNKDVKCQGLMGPVPDHLEDIWGELCLGKYLGGPIVGPFEIAIPEWCDFHDLVYGEDGALYAMIEDEALIDRDIVITWSMKNGRPSSLVVGPKSTLKCVYEDKQLWLRVRTTWLKVAEWVAGVYFGRPHRLTDFLRYRQEQELMEVIPLQLDEVMSHLIKRWNLMSEDPAKSALDAQGQREDVDVWAPQVEAILSQPWRYASQMAQTWVMREGVKVALRRLEVAEYRWAAFHPRNAYTWGRHVYECIRT